MNDTLRIHTADNETLMHELADLADRLGHCNPASQQCVLAASRRLKTALQSVSSLEKSQEKAISALMAQEVPLGGPACPRELEFLDEEYTNSRYRIGFRCVHRKFDGQCPYEMRDEGATEFDIWECWRAWLEGRKIG